MHLAHRGPHDVRTAFASSILHHETGGEIAHDHTFPASRVPVPAQHRSHRERERIVLPDWHAVLVHDRQSVDVGIDRDSERRTDARDEGRKPAQVLRDRLRGSGEAPVRLKVDAGDLAAQALEQRAHDRPPCTPHRVEGHGELPLPNPLDIDCGELQDGVEMPLYRPIVGRDLPRPPPSSPVLPNQLLHPRAIRLVQEDPIGPDELQSVPLDRVVARRDRDPAAGHMMLDSQLDGRGRDETDGDDGTPHRDQPVDHCPLERRPGLSGIPSDDHQRLPLLGPEAEGPRVPPHDLLGQVLPHDASDARDTDHQRAGHADNLIRRG